MEASERRRNSAKRVSADGMANGLNTKGGKFHGREIGKKASTYFACKNQGKLESALR